VEIASLRRASRLARLARLAMTYYFSFFVGGTHKEERYAAIELLAMTDKGVEQSLHGR